MQYCSMSAVLSVSKRGTVTLPPEYRRKLGLDKLPNPLVIIEEKDGKLTLEPAAAVPVRDIPARTIREWIADDEAAMAAFKKSK